jgi:hypothetical protein
MKRNSIAMLVVLVVGLLIGALGGRIRAAAPEEAKISGEPEVGESCIIYLRGDASGAGFHDRLTDLGNLISRKGTVVAVAGEWVAIKDGDRHYHIPRASIMLMQSDTGTRSRDAGAR